MKNFIQKRVLPICLMLALCLSVLPSVAFAAVNATNIASSGYMTGGGAWAYTADKVYNSSRCTENNVYYKFFIFCLNWL